MVQLVEFRGLAFAPDAVAHLAKQLDGWLSLGNE